jgi:hypothetical protein
MKEEATALLSIQRNLEDLEAELNKSAEPEDIANASDTRISETRAALDTLNSFLSGGEERLFGGTADTYGLMSTFLCGDDFVAAMNGGALTLRVNPSDGERRVSFSSNCSKAKAAWARLHRN